MSTPGRRRALKALAARKQANQQRVNRGEKPIVNKPGGGTKKVSALWGSRSDDQGSRRHQR